MDAIELCTRVLACTANRHSLLATHSKLQQLIFRPVIILTDSTLAPDTQEEADPHTRVQAVAAH